MSLNIFLKFTILPIVFDFGFFNIGVIDLPNNPIL